MVVGMGAPEPEPTPGRPAQALRPVGVEKNETIANWPTRGCPLTN